MILFLIGWIAEAALVASLVSEEAAAMLLYFVGEALVVVWCKFSGGRMFGQRANLVWQRRCI